MESAPPTRTFVLASEVKATLKADLSSRSVPLLLPVMIKRSKKVKAESARPFSSTKLLILATLFVVFALTNSYATDITVAAPASPSVVNSPLLLQAQSSSCSAQPTASMAYSVDSGTDTVFSGATSIKTNISIAGGSHTLRVKAWGNSGAFCEVDLALTVGGGVNVTSPTGGSTINTTFSLQAQATTCGGQNTSSMAYSFDNSADTVLTGATSISRTVSTSAGTHILRVKAWGNGGAYCETDLSISTVAGVSVQTPSNNAHVTSPFPLQAQAPTCQNITTSSMAWSLDSLSDHIFSGAQSLDTSVTSATGSHVLRVKAWNTSGALCETDVNITVDASTGGGLTPGSTQNAFVGIEQDGDNPGPYDNCGGSQTPQNRSWQTQPDCGTPPLGTMSGKSGTTQKMAPPTPPPSNDSTTRQYQMTYTQSGGGVRWFDPLTNDSVNTSGPANDTFTQFQYDAWIYFPNDSNNVSYSRSVMNIEMDLNQVVTETLSDGTVRHNLYIFATQCNLERGKWQVTRRANGWVDTDQPCTRSQWEPAAGAQPIWHHVQIQFYRGPNPTDSITYYGISMDGGAAQLFQNCAQENGTPVPACDSTPSLGTDWTPGTLGPNFQLDGESTSGGSVTAYVDKFIIYRW
jgi:hypothetical protein